MFLLLTSSVSLVFVGAMLLSLIVIIASIGWIKELYKVKKNNKYRSALRVVPPEKK